MLGRASLAQDGFSGAYNTSGFFPREQPALEEQLPSQGNSMMRLVSCIWEEGAMIWVVSMARRDGTECVLGRGNGYSPLVIYLDLELKPMTSSFPNTGLCKACNQSPPQPHLTTK